MRKDQVTTNVQEIRKYIVGGLVESQEKLQRSIDDKAAFIKIMDDLETALLEARLKVDESFDHERQELEASVALHQTMLTHMDEEAQKAADEGKVMRDSLISTLRPLNAALEMLDKDIRVRFQKAKPAEPKPEPVIKQTVIEHKEPERLGYTPTEMYIKRNMVNNQYLAARMIDYFRRIGVLHIRELVVWMEREFPELKNRWSSMEKGVQNVMRLIKEQNLEPVSYGVYRLKKDENIG